MIPPEQIQNKKRRTVHSISFKEEDRKIIELAAQQEGVGFATFLKRATLEYIKESLEYQRLVDSGAMKAEQKVMPEAFGAFEDTVRNTLLSVHENIKCRLRRIEWLAENNLYYQCYFNRVIPEEEQENMSKLANHRMKKIMERLKTELGHENEERTCV